MYIQHTNSYKFVVFRILFVKIVLTEIVCYSSCSINNISTIKRSHFEAKIIGGKSASLGRFPFQAQLFNLGALCSGTILNSWTILTSAHCLDYNKDTRNMRVQAGSRYIYDFRARIYPVESFVIHKKYNISAQFVNDIALLFLKKALHFGKLCQKGILVNNNRWMNSKEKDFLASGWGWTMYGGPVSETGLMMTRLSFVSAKSCGRMHQLNITPDMFCLYGEGSRDTCKGDSGGGVLWKGMIVGVTSHGDGCAKKHKPSVYTNVFYFRNWIKRQVKKFFDTYCQRKEKNQLMLK